MIINYPNYYLIPISVMSLDEDEYSFGNKDEYSFGNKDEYSFGNKDEYSFRCNMEECEGDITHINENKDIFQEADEEYVNESTK